MRLVFCLVFVGATMLSQTTLFARGVDLDKAFLKATGSAIPTSNKAFAQEDNSQWDGTGGFSAVVDQSPLGACQSFAATAFAEYIFYRQTGKVIKFSEKYTAYELIQLLIDEFWNPDEKKYDAVPQLGAGIDAFLIESLIKSGLMPETNYPWGNLETDQSKQINIPLFQKIFNPDADPLDDASQYRDALNQAFLSAPPANFYYSFQNFDFSTGKNKEVVIKSPQEMLDYLNITKDRFKILYNKELQPLFDPIPADQRDALMAAISKLTSDKNIANELVSADDLTKEIVASLEHRMVVGIAADVWVGDWQRQLVNEGTGGHAIIIVGYQVNDDDHETYFKIRNSWGSKPGIGGYNYVKASILMPNVFWAKIYK